MKDSEKAARVRDGQKEHQRENPTTARAIRANNHRSLTPEQRGRFWQSVGEAIEQAARAAGVAS